MSHREKNKVGKRLFIGTAFFDIYGGEYEIKSEFCTQVLKVWTF